MHYVKCESFDTLKMIVKWAEENGYRVTINDSAEYYANLTMSNRKEPQMGTMLVFVATMNKYFKFPKNIPDRDVWLWWNIENQKWEIWFGECPPTIADKEFTPFTEKCFHYRMVKD